MEKYDICSKNVKSIQIHTPKTVTELLEDMRNTGFQGRRLAETCEVFHEMINVKDLTIILGFSGSLSVAGQWRIITWLIENGFINILVPTGANISEDLIEAMGHSYYIGTDKVDDSKLFEFGLNRFYDIYGKETDYVEMTELIAEFILTLKEQYNYSSREFLYLFGKWLEKRNIYSIVTYAAQNNIPIFCPAIADSPYGDAALIAKSQGFTLVIDSIKDYVEFMGLAKGISDTGVFYIGGGVPKDFIQLFAVTADLLYKDHKIPNRKGAGKQRDVVQETCHPHRYAIQITTNSHQWGGLSGCSFEEAISWGKEALEGKFVQCHCDATIALPIIMQSIAERNPQPRIRRDFSELFKQ